MGGRNRYAVRLMKDLGVRYAHALRLMRVELATETLPVSYEELCDRCLTKLIAERTRDEPRT